MYFSLGARNNGKLFLFRWPTWRTGLALLGCAICSATVSCVFSRMGSIGGEPREFLLDTRGANQVIAGQPEAFEGGSVSY